MAEQYPGPLATMILSDVGADVIQVERLDTAIGRTRHPRSGRQGAPPLTW